MVIFSKKFLSLAIISACFVALQAGFTFANQFSTIKVTGTNSSLQLQSPLTNYAGTLELKDNTAGTFTAATGSDTVTFNNGIFRTGAVETTLSATLDAASTDKIILNNGNLLNVSAGTILQDVEVAAGATATILGQPRFTNNIIAGSTSSVLSLGITTALNKSFLTSGGDSAAISLLDDLSISGNVMIQGLTLNGKAVTFTQDWPLNATSLINPGLPVTGPGTIELLANASVPYKVAISDSVSLAGNGKVLTLAPHATLPDGGFFVNTGGSLYISDLHIKGLNSAGFQTIGGTGTNYFSNTTLQLEAAYTQTGPMVFQGDNCKLITNGFAWTIDSTLTVDGVILEYEQLDGSGNNPFVVGTGSISLLNGGNIRAVGASATTPPGITINTAALSSYTLTDNIFVTANYPVTVSNTTGAADAVTIDGAGHFMHFASTGSYFIIEDNANLSASTTVTFQNIVLKNFRPSVIDYSGNSSSSIIFGAGVTLELESDIVIASTDKKLSFAGGESYILGHGRNIEISKAAGLEIANSINVNFKDVNLIFAIDAAISCLGVNSRLTLENTNLELGVQSYDFTQGNIDITGRTYVTSVSPNNENCYFAFSSSGFLTIGKPDLPSLGRPPVVGALFFEPGVTLNYTTNPGGDTAAQKKRHIKFAHKNSSLNLNNTTVISTTNNGLALEGGTLTIANRCILQPSTTAGKEIELRKDMEVNILANAILDIDGPVLAMTDADISWGDVVNIKHLNFGFYLTGSPNNYAHVGATTYQQVVGQNNSGTASQWTLASLAAQSGVINANSPTLSLASMQNVSTTRYLNSTDRALAINPPVLAQPSYNLLSLISSAVDDGNEIRIQKVDTSLGDTLSSGDIVTLFFNKNAATNHQCYLFSVNNLYTATSTSLEVAGIVSAPTTNTNHYWIVEKA